MNKPRLEYCASYSVRFEPELEIGEMLAKDPTEKHAIATEKAVNKTKLCLNNLLLWVFSYKFSWMTRSRFNKVFTNILNGENLSKTIEREKFTRFVELYKWR